MAAANGTARQQGILPHMPLSQASTLSPNAQCIEHDPQADVEGLMALAEGAQCFSPITGIETIDAQLWAGRSMHQPQAVLLDVTGIAPLFGSEAILLQSVATWVARHGYVASVAIADTVGAAWALANYRHRTAVAEQLRSIEADPSLPCCASNTAAVGVGESHAKDLHPLPVAALRLDIATITKLRRLGIHTIGQLIALPRSGLAARFDPILLTRIDQALHGQSESIRALHAAPELCSQHIFEHPTSHPESIEHFVRTLVAQLVARLTRIGHGALRIVCRIEMERQSLPVDHEPNEQPVIAHVVQLGLFQPSADASHLEWLLLGQLDSQRLANKNDFLVRSIRLQATLTGPIVWQQSDLFDAEANKQRDSIARLIDGLSSRLGRSAVVAPSMTRDPQPELVIAWRPLTGRRNDGGVQKTKRKLAKEPRRDYASKQTLQATQEELHRRPTQLLPKPLEIQIAPIGQDSQQAPAWIVYDGTRQHVTHAVGPERIESGWWQGSTQRREYFRVDLGGGQRLWIYHDLKNGGWFLHGEFD